MRYRTLGNTGLKVSEICLGAMTFGGRDPQWQAIGALDQKASTEMVARALAAGVNFFDTADGYGGGDSELFLGRALGSRLNEVVIATKVGFPTGPGPNDRGLSRRHILDAVEASLRRLERDHIDLYFLHRNDPATPAEESLRALDDLVRAGKVRYTGVSNWPAWKIADAVARQEERGWSRLECLQMYYSLAARDIEREIVPLCSDRRLGLMIWSPLSQGILTGKFGADHKAPEGSRRAAYDVGPVNWDRVDNILDEAHLIAKKRNCSLAQVCLAWLLAQEFVTSVVIGARKIEQLEENLGAAALALEPGEMSKLDAASVLPAEYPTWFLRLFDSM